MMYRHNLVKIANLLIGKTMDEAVKIYPKIRIVVADGHNLADECEHCCDRINVETGNGIITDIIGVH